MAPASILNMITNNAKALIMDCLSNQALTLVICRAYLDRHYIEDLNAHTSGCFSDLKWVFLLCVSDL